MDLRPSVKGKRKRKCRQYSKEGSDKSKVDKHYYVSVKKIRSIIIDNLLIMSNIEINPGPQARVKAKIIDIVTFNCNGMNNKQKLKRIIRKSNTITDKNGIVMLQESHIMKDEQVKFLTKSNYQISSHRSNSAGVITMYGASYETIYNSNGLDGRQQYTIIQDGEIKLLLVNIYCPNDHRQSINFLEGVYSKILEITYEHPDCQVILGGDFNSCMTKDDYLNRNKSRNEDELTEMIRLNNSICNLIDSFLLVNTKPSFTWNRGNCYSRLDYIYFSSNLSNKIISSDVDWAFERSDHAAVRTRISMLSEIQKGPGIVKVNVDILSDRYKREQISKEIEIMIKQIPTHWNGHMKLEFLKMSIRSIFSNFVSIARKEDKVELESLEQSLNDIEKLRQKVVRYIDNLQDENVKISRLAKVEQARNTIKTNLEDMRKKIAAKSDFKTSAKWYEYGDNQINISLARINFKLNRN